MSIYVKVVCLSSGYQLVRALVYLDVQHLIYPSICLLLD